jgi:TonB family protein
VALETPAPAAPPPAAGDIAPAEGLRQLREKPPKEKAAKKPVAPPPLEPPVPAGVPSEEKPAAAPIFGSTLEKAFPEAEKKKRTGLYAMIAAAVVILAAGIFFVLRKPAPTAGPLPAPTAAPATPVAALAEPTPEPILQVPVPDQKAIQEEAQRQLALRRKEMQKAADATAAARPPAGKSVAQAVAPTAAAPSVEPSPEPKVAEAPPRPEPTAVPPPPLEPSPVSAPPARQEAPEVSRGDLVGPGPGVVEPALLSSPKVSYPPAVRQQIVPGKVVVLVLVDENGAVAGARLQQGVVSRLVNEAVLQSVRGSKFQAATKNGIPVKMWRTIVVDVRP